MIVVTFTTVGHYIPLNLSDGEIYPKCIGYGKVLCINFVLGYLSVLVSDLFSLLMMNLYGVLPKVGQFY